MDDTQMGGLPSTVARHRLARAVAAARAARGLSTYTLAKQARVSRATVQLLEAGTHSPRVETLQRIADALGVRICALIAGEAA